MASMELRYSLVPLLLLLLLTWPVTARQEVEVLLDVKNALDPQGMVLMSWQAGGQPCSGDFEGVLCDPGSYLAIKPIYLAKSVVGIYAKLTSGNDISFVVVVGCCLGLRGESCQHFITRAVVDRLHTRRLGGALSAHWRLPAFQRAAWRHPSLAFHLDKPHRFVPQLEPLLWRHPSSAGPDAKLTR